MRKIFLFLIGFLLLFNVSSANTYLSNEQINGMIDTYNQLFNTDLPEFNLSHSYSKMAIAYTTNASRVYLYLSNSTSGSVNNNDFSYSGGSARMYRVTNGAWQSYGSVVSGFQVTYPQLIVGSNLPVTSSASNIWYIYDLLNGNLTQRVDIVENDVDNLNTRVTTIERQVTDIETESASISAKLDTVIDNQETTNGMFSDLFNNTSQTENDFSSAFPEIEVNDVTEQTFSTVTNSVFNSFTGSGAQTISFTVNGHSYSISSSQFNISGTGLGSFLATISSFGVSLWLIKDLRRELEKIKEGKIEKIASEDISADIV